MHNQDTKHITEAELTHLEIELHTFDVVEVEKLVVLLLQEEEEEEAAAMWHRRPSQFFAASSQNWRR